MTLPGVEYWSGRQYGWRYMAQVMDGTGVPGAWLSHELPLSNVSITDVLSGPPQMTGTISPLHRQLLAEQGVPLLRPWRCAIYAEQDGIIRYGGILVVSAYEGPSWSLDVSGFVGYPTDMPYEGETAFVQTDPLDIWRHIWAHVQAGPESNLGLVVDPYTNTGGAVLLGRVPILTSFDPEEQAQQIAGSTDEQPYRLAHYANHDLGADIDDLAKNTPFDYHERHQWNADKTAVEHYVDAGYPRLGTRKTDLRFVLGENIQTIPSIEDDGTEYASDVRFLGAGEGSAMVMGRASVATGGLRRVKTVDDKRVTDKARADVLAGAELRSRLTLTNTPSVAVRNTPSTPLGAWGVGDEIRIQVEQDWRGVDLWYRVLSMTITPEAPEIVTMDLLRTDRGAA